jgi:4-hydroxy-3-methylbut-2-enyl diphosphate reductase
MADVCAAADRHGRFIRPGGEAVSENIPPRVLLAAPRGFCAGVERAVTIVERALEVHGRPVYVRRHIVHNLTVVARLTDLGAVFVAETADVPPGAVVIFSAHGVAPAEYEEAARRDLTVIDATCPLVTKVHREARRLRDAGYDILLVGQPGHDETIGTLGVAAGSIQIVDPSAPAADIDVRDPARVAWLSQTTLSFGETGSAVRRLRRQLPQLADPPSDDICYAAENRQNAVREIAGQADVVLVVGSAHSHNSAMLARVAQEYGAPAAYLVEGPEGADPRWLDGASTVGVTAGASAPADQVTALLDWLAGHGYGDVREVTVARETQRFALPAPLREAGGPQRASGRTSVGR